MNITAQDALLVNSILFMFGFVIVVFIIVKYRNRVSKLNSFGLYFLLNALGAGLMYHRNTAPEFFTIIVANYIIILAGIFMVIGVSNFFNKKVPYKMFVIISLIVIFFTIYFTYIDFNFSARTIIFGVVVIMTHVHVLRILHINRVENNSEIDLLSIMISILITSMLFRAVILSLSEIPDTFYEVTGLAPLNTILISISGALISPGILSLINNKLLDEVKEGEHTFSNLIGNSPVPAMVHAEDGEMMYISDEFTKITGYTHKDLPNIETWIKAAYTEKRDEIRTIISNLYKYKDVKIDNVIEIITKDGTGQGILEV